MSEKKENAVSQIDRARVSQFMQESSNVFAENKLLRLVLIAMVVWSAFNSIMLNNALDDRTVVIMPPNEGYKMEVTNKEVGDEYLYKMARYIVFLSGNLTAATGRDQLNEILRLVHPSRYGEFQDHFNTLAKEIERYPNISYVITIDGVDGMNVEGKVLTIRATKKRLVGNTLTRKERLTYEITYQIDNGRFWIMDIQELTKKSGANQND